MNDISIDVFREDDLEGLIALLRSELRAENITHEDLWDKVFLYPNFRREGAITAKAGGRVVGFMLGILRRQPIEDAPLDSDRGWITLMAVDQEFQHRGIGTALLSRATDYLKRGGASTVWVSPYVPNYFTPGVDEAAYPEAIAFLVKHGFEVAYRPISMQVSLLDFPPPEAAGKEKDASALGGVLIDSFKPEYILPVVEHVRAEFPGDWQRLVRKTILSITEDGEPPEQLFVAIEDGKCIGFCRHEGERFGPLGVAASHRRRGIASALLFGCLRAMAVRGFYRAWLAWTDERAAKLYATAGFQITRRYSVMRLEQDL